jgi:hypothetical protein
VWLSVTGFLVRRNENEGEGFWRHTVLSIMHDHRYFEGVCE